MALENWKTKFDELFSELDDSWHLEIVNDIVRESGWLKVKYRGRATFKCSSATCNNTWPCANSSVVFYFRLSSSGIGRPGEVKLFLGGQKCIYCKDVFEAAEWPDTEIKRAITKLLNEVTKGGDLVSTEPDTDDQGIVTAHLHFSYLCQLCSLGVCVDIEGGPGQRYSMQKPYGTALIINIKKFSGETKDGDALNDREGSEKDVKKLKELWEQLSFTVKSPQEGRKKAHNIYDFLFDAAKEIDEKQNSSCFVCCIMSHGDLGKIYGEDGKHVDIKDILNMFKESNCKALAGKPKLFFIQACRVAKKEVDQPAEPNEPHFLLGYSTARGQLSLRSPEEGTWYISALVEVFNKHHNAYDVLSMISEVNNIVLKRHIKEELVTTQCPAPITTLTNAVYL